MFLYNLENCFSFLPAESAPYQGTWLRELNAVSSSASFPFRQSALMQSTTCAAARGHPLGIRSSTLLREGCSISFICFSLSSPIFPFSKLLITWVSSWLSSLFWGLVCWDGVCICCILPFNALPRVVAPLPYVLDSRVVGRTCSVQADSYLPWGYLEFGQKDVNDCISKKLRNHKWLWAITQCVPDKCHQPFGTTVFLKFPMSLVSQRAWNSFLCSTKSSHALISILFLFFSPEDHKEYWLVFTS